MSYWHSIHLMLILCYSFLIFYFLMQVVELDFLYPSEGIHRRWENGYRITSTAATPDQAAFILSIPKKKLMDETQETLRTSAFPSNHVKVNHMLQKLAQSQILLVFWTWLLFSYGDSKVLCTMLLSTWMPVFSWIHELYILFLRYYECIFVPYGNLVSQ